MRTANDGGSPGMTRNTNVYGAVRPCVISLYALRLSTKMLSSRDIISQQSQKKAQVLITAEGAWAMS
jgi:hypothetical protein